MTTLRKISLVAIALCLVLPQFSYAAPAKKVAPKPVDLNGRIVIATENAGRAWYILPTTHQRWYLQNTTEFVAVARSLAVAISSADLKSLSTTTQAKSKTNVLKKYSGRFIIEKESDQVWYVHPEDGLRYPVTGEADTQALFKMGLPVKNKDLARFPMNTKQLMFDPYFSGTASAKIKNHKLVAGTNVNVVRPIASLTKIMTALVLIDLNFDFSKVITITPAQIHYPRTMVGGDATSEVDLQAGDQVFAQDLWVAMLVASSNQSAVILVDNSGLTRADFIARMNAKAKSLGLTRTSFSDMTGLSDFNMSTAKEMGLLAEAAFALPTIADTTQILEQTFYVTDAAGQFRSVRILDRNYSLRAFGVQAAKSGYLVEAGRNAVVKKDEATYVSLHASSLTQRNNIIKQLISK